LPVYENWCIIDSRWLCIDARVWLHNPPEEDVNRRIAATVLTVLAVIAALLVVLDVLRYLGILPLASLGEIDFFGTSVLGAIIAAFVAAIWFWAARGTWNIDPWAAARHKRGLWAAIASRDI
jgi:hypothetical protein